MRSRYSAFALGMADYLLRTWHTSTRPRLDLRDNPEWVRLEVLTSGHQGDQGHVHFRAFYRSGGELGMLAEESHFVRDNGVWYYVSGKHSG